MTRHFSNIAVALISLIGSLTITACQNNTNATNGSFSNNQPGTASTKPHPDGLKLGSLLPLTGDLSAIGQSEFEALPLLVETVNQCGGVNGQPITLISEDDQTEPLAGTEAMTKLAEVNKVAGVVGSIASSVSSAAVEVAVRNQVMLISPGSSSPLFTERAKKGELKGFWARTIPPDTYQARALAKLARDQGIQRVSTVVINNDYGRGFENEFVQSFKRLGGTVVNEAKPTRFDPKAITFETEVAAAFAGHPDAVVAVLYVDTGGLFFKSAYEQGVMKGSKILLTEGVYTPEFPQQVGKAADGKWIMAGAIGTIPGADGQALSRVTNLFMSKKGKPPGAFVPQTWDAAALIVLAAEAAKANTGEGIKSKVRDIANPPGLEVTDVCQGLELLRQGKQINYQGASGNVDINEYGDALGSYDVWSIKDNGKLAVVGKVRPE
jgi:neutral amino acid transport system substrate-binding protein